MTQERLRTLCEQTQRLALLALLLVVPLIFFTSTYDVFETNKLAAFRVFSLVGLLAFLVQKYLGGGVKLERSSLYPPLAAILISSLLSTLWTNNALVSWFGVYEDYEGILTIANYALLFFLANQTLRTAGQVRPFFTVILLAGGLAAGYGVLQNFGIDFVLWNPTTYTASRLFGSLGNPNFLAAYVLMTLPLALFGFLTPSRPVRKALHLALVLVMLVCIFFTQSRGAMYALAVQFIALAAYLVYDARRQGGLMRANRRWLLALAVLLGFALLLPSVRTTVTVTAARTLATLNVKEIKITPRLYIWRSALQMIRDHPVLGTGLDTFQITFPKYRLAEYWRLEWNGTPEKAHNFFLQIGATTGLLGLAAWLWLLAVFFRLVWQAVRDLPPPRRHLAAAAGIAQIGFLVQDQFNFTVVAYGSLFFFYFAFVSALSKPEAPAAMPAKAAPAPKAGATGADVLVLAGAAGLVCLGLVLTLRTWTADVYFKRGIISLSSGSPERAVTDLGQAVRLDPLREIYWVKYGIAYEEVAKRAVQKQQALQQAAEIHRHTIALNPLNGYDFNNLGRVLKYWGDYLDPAKLKEAEAACLRATELDPFNVYFALDLASVYLSQRRLDEAQAVARRLVETFPDFAIPYAYLGYAALMKEDQAAAYGYLSQAVAANWRGDNATQASTWSNLGIVRARRNDLTGAVEAFTRALDLRSDYLEARLNLAVMLERLQRIPEALSEYRRIVQEAPGWPQAESLKKKIATLERGNPT